MLKYILYEKYRILTTLLFKLMKADVPWVISGTVLGEKSCMHLLCSDIQLYTVSYYLPLLIHMVIGKEVPVFSKVCQFFLITVKLTCFQHSCSRTNAIFDSLTSATIS